MKSRTKKLILNNSGEYLSRDKGCLVVRDSKGIKKRFPLFDNQLTQIEMRSGNLASSGALTTACCWRIPIILETSKGHAVGILRSLHDEAYVQTRISQYESLHNGKGAQIAKTFLIHKLKGQDKLLSKYGLKRLDLYHLTERINSLEGKDERSIRVKLNTIEGHCADRYFEELFGLLDESIRPEKRRGFKAFDAVNNLFNLTYTILKYRVHVALLSAHLEPYLGYLHGLAPTKPSLVCDFLELYRYLMDDFLLTYARNLKLKPTDFVLKDEVFSIGKKSKRQYVNDELQNQYLKRLDAYFQSKVDLPRMRRGERQELETLINEEALLFAQYLRNEKQTWVPRIASLTH